MYGTYSASNTPDGCQDDPGDCPADDFPHDCEAILSAATDAAFRGRDAEIVLDDESLSVYEDGTGRRVLSYSPSLTIELDAICVCDDPREAAIESIAIIAAAYAAALKYAKQSC